MIISTNRTGGSKSKGKKSRNRPPLKYPLRKDYTRFPLSDIITYKGGQVLVKIHDKTKWLPKDWINIGIDFKEGNPIAVVDVPDWLAEKERLK